MRRLAIPVLAFCLAMQSILAPATAATTSPRAEAVTRTEAPSPIVKRGLTIGYIDSSWLDITAVGILLLIFLGATLGRDRTSERSAAASETPTPLGARAHRAVRLLSATPARTGAARAKGLPVYVLRDVVEDGRGG